MKRVSILVACAIMMLPASQAFAGTWSWHSEIMQKISDIIHQNMPLTPGNAQPGHRTGGQQSAHQATGGAATGRTATGTAGH